MKKNNEIKPIVDIIQANKGGLKTSSFPKVYNKLKLKVSFGQGVAARIPWIGIYKDPNTISKGIYPCFLYYKEYSKLILAYGISETEKVDHNWGDTKWKRPTNQSSSISDLRQMYAYNRFWNAQKAMLLYPGKPKNSNFKPFETEDFFRLNEKTTSIQHLCKSGFVSVLDIDNRLSNTIGKHVLFLLEEKDFM